TSEALSAASSNTLHTPGYSSRILSIWNNSLAPSPFSFLKTSLEGLTSEALSAASPIKRFLFFTSALIFPPEVQKQKSSDVFST
ncbi:hypothetical protein AVEN_63665-1, partial [Araneus ventricosus]